MTDLNILSKFISIISSTPGDSACGNLAAAVALRLRGDNIRPALKMQVLLYPVLQAIDYQLPSHIDDDCPILPDDMTVFCMLWYPVCMMVILIFGPN